MTVLELFENPDVILDVASALGIPEELAKEMIDQAKVSTLSYIEMTDSLKVNVISSGPGIIEAPTRVPKNNFSSDEYRIKTFLEHNGVPPMEAASIIKSWKTGGPLYESDEFWKKYPKVSELLPPDLVIAISNL